MIGQIGLPDQNGTYVCQVYYGWKLLEWRNSQWCFDNTNAAWKPGVIQWCGPLPEQKTVDLEYDL